MNPPENPCGGVGVRDEKRGQVGDHEQEDQEGDEAGFPGELLAEPLGANEKTADEKAENACGAGQGEDGGNVSVEAAKEACGVEEAEPEPYGEMV